MAFSFGLGWSGSEPNGGNQGAAEGGKTFSGETVPPLAARLPLSGLLVITPVLDSYPLAPPYTMCRMKRALQLLATVLLVQTFAFAESVHLDDSDWWSLLRVDQPGPKPGRVVTPRTNFNVLGINLFDDNLFKTVAKRLGDATDVQRGDAATGRDQLCYVSVDRTVHLVFEQGEVDSVVYLFRDGQNWTGSDLCRRSPLLTETVSTASGLRLGMTIAEVRKILGIPSVQDEDKLIYARQTKQRMPPTLLEEIRRNDPHHYTDEEFHRQFDFYDESVYIEARFANHKLTYLAISQSGTT